MATTFLVSCNRTMDPADPGASGGTTDETSTVAFYLPDGSPAAGARVQIFASSDTTRKPRDQVFADQQGRVRLPRLEADYYNLMARDERGRAIFQDSLVSDGKRMDFASDTLVETGVVVGRVRVQPQHSPRIVWIALLGSGTYLNVDDSGRFRIEGVAEGRYTVAGFTKTEGYTTTFGALRVKRDSVSDIGTLEMVFTGLPVVRNLEARFDTLAGVVHLRWDSLPLRETWKFTVQRDGVDLGETTGSTWIDVVSDEYPADVPSEGRHSYRVVVSDAERPGPLWETIEMRIISAYLYQDVKVNWVRKGTRPWNGGVFAVDTLGGSLVMWRAPEFGSNGKEIGGSETKPIWAIDGVERWESLDSGSTWSRDPVAPSLAALPVRFEGRWWSLVGNASALGSIPEVPGFGYSAGYALVRLRDTFHVVSSADGRTWDTVTTLHSTVPMADLRIERDASKMWLIGSGQRTTKDGNPFWGDGIHWISETGRTWSQVVVDPSEFDASLVPSHMSMGPFYQWSWWAGRWWSLEWAVRGGGADGWYLGKRSDASVGSTWPEWPTLQRFSGPSVLGLSSARSIVFYSQGEAVTIDSSSPEIHPLAWPGGGFHRELLWGGRILSISDSGVYLGRILSGLEGGDPRGTWVKKTETPRVF